MTSLTSTDYDLLALIGDSRVTLADLVRDGFCLKLSCMPENLRARLEKLVAAKLVRKVKVPQERIPLGRRQFGNRQPLWAYEAVR